MWKNLYAILRKYIWWIVLTYILLIVEFVLSALVPYVMGLAIDALIQVQYEKFVIYVLVSAFGLATGYSRRRLDTRIYIKVWHDQNLQYIKTMLEKNVETSKVVSRLYLLRTYADFFEHTLPMVTQIVIEILVAFIMLLIVMPVVAYVAIVLFFFGLAVQYVCSQRMNSLELELHSYSEYINEAVAKKEFTSIEHGYRSLVPLIVKRSDYDATSWSLIDILSIVIELMVIFHIVYGHHSIGSVMSTAAYGRSVFNKMNCMNILFSHYRQMKLLNKLMDEDNLN